ncbi:hypothetical protein KSS88_15840 [Bacillus altitudinis]|uniref:hypothetical protein n=1 Tax=Bacillus sp. FSL W8-0006 TaxID=2954567 RepID=UPI001C228B0C|nr:hypothetical protein [Bacillus altitudinis]MBU8970327.1 hypothetical protein [Bacillus altitudinis]
MLDKKISIGHFVYTTIIALLIITFILVFVFGDNKDAGNQVNVMATGISIILAVIAILMTLVDVAGQRQSIIDIKETAEKLMKNQKASDDALEKSIETLEFLSSFREEMLASVSEFKDLTEERLQELLSKETIDKSDLDVVLKDISRETSQLDSKLRITSSKDLKLDIDWSYRKIIDKLFPDRKTVKVTEFMDGVESKYDKKFAIKMLSFLKSQGYIMRNFNDDLDYVYIAAVRRDLN